MISIKDLGMGKSSMEDMIGDEVEKLVKLLEKVSVQKCGFTNFLLIS